MRYPRVEPRVVLNHHTNTNVTLTCLLFESHVGPHSFDTVLRTKKPADFETWLREIRAKTGNDNLIDLNITIQDLTDTDKPMNWDLLMSSVQSGILEYKVGSSYVKNIIHLLKNMGHYKRGFIAETILRKSELSKSSRDELESMVSKKGGKSRRKTLYGKRRFRKTRRVRY